MQTDNFLDKRKAYLMTVQALVNIALPIFAAAFFVNQAALYDLEHLLGGISWSFILIIFIAFMQIVSASELYTELNLRTLLFGLLTPLGYMGVSAFFNGVSVGWYLFEMGALYTMAITLAFSFLVFLRPLVSGAWFTFNLKEALGYVAISLPQLIFIGPGIVVGWLYIQLLLAEVFSDGILGWEWWRLAVFVIGLIQLAQYEYYWMHKGSPNLKGRAKT